MFVLIQSEKLLSVFLTALESEKHSPFMLSLLYFYESVSFSECSTWYRREKEWSKSSCQIWRTFINFSCFIILFFPLPTPGFFHSKENEYKCWKMEFNICIVILQWFWSEMSHREAMLQGGWVLVSSLELLLTMLFNVWFIYPLNSFQFKGEFKRLARHHTNVLGILKF